MGAQDGAARSLGPRGLSGDEAERIVRRQLSEQGIPVRFTAEQLDRYASFFGSGRVGRRRA